MEMLKIIKEGHPTLRKVASKVKLPLKESDKTTLIGMMNYLKMSQIPEIAEKEGIQPGVGIAAPQINVSKRMFCIFTTDMEGNLHEYAFVNPEIIKKSKEITYLPFGEGCLSVDREVEGVVPRYSEIIVKTKLLDTEKGTLRSVKMRLSGYIGIVFQHEFDHLDGILYPDKADLVLEDATPLFEIELEEDE